MPIILSGPSTALETLVFDPVSEDADNTPVELIAAGSDAYRVLEHAYPAPPARLQWASSVDTEGSLLASSGYENRTITLKIDCSDWTSWLTLQAKVAKLGREGGTLRRDLPSGDVRIYDILASPSYEAAFSHEFYAGVTTVDLALDAKPHARGEEIALSSHSETDLPALIFTETDVPGDVPALGRLVVTNGTPDIQRWFVWGLQSRHYDAATTAALFYQAEACAGAVPTAGPAGANGSGNNTHFDGSLGAAFTFQISIGATQAQTHVGSFRVFARVYSPTANTGTVQLQLKYATSGAGTSAARFTYRDPVTLNTSYEGSWAIYELGQVSIPETRRGTQAWEGSVWAKSTSAGDDLYTDWVMLVPIDEGSGEVKGVDGSFVPLFPSKRLEVSSEGVLTESATTDVWRDTTNYEGDNLLIPVAGLSGRTVRLIAKYSRGGPGQSEGLDLGSDTATDDISAQLFITPRYLV